MSSGDEFLQKPSKKKRVIIPETSESSDDDSPIQSRHGKKKVNVSYYFLHCFSKI